MRYYKVLVHCQVEYDDKKLSCYVYLRESVRDCVCVCVYRHYV